jgi:hypothetical protein
MGRGGQVGVFGSPRRSVRGWSVCPRGPIRTREDQMGRPAGDALTQWELTSLDEPMDELDLRDAATVTDGPDKVEFERREDPLDLTRKFRLPIADPSPGIEFRRPRAGRVGVEEN